MGSSDRTGGMQQQGYRQESSSQSQSQSSDNYGSSSRTGGAQQYGEGGYGTAGQGHDTQQSGYREGQSNQYGGGGSSNYDSSLPAGGQGRSARKSGLDGTSVARGGASGYGGNDSKDYKSSLLQKDYDETKGGSRLGDAAGAQYSNQGQGYDNQSQGYDNRSGGTQDTYADQKLTGEEPGYKMVEANVAGKLHGQTAAEGDGSYGDLRNDDTTDGYGASRNSVDEGAHSGKRSTLHYSCPNAAHAKYDPQSLRLEDSCTRLRICCTRADLEGQGSGIGVKLIEAVNSGRHDLIDY